MSNQTPSSEQIELMHMLFDKPRKITKARESRIAKLHPDFLRPAYQYTPSEVHDEQFLERYNLE